jgi:hypothetical protein
MTRSEILSLITQAAAALTTEPQEPATFTDADKQRIIDIHAAVVAVKRTAVVPTVASEVQTALSVQETREVLMSPSIPPSLEPPPKKKNFWQKLGGGMKTTLVAIGAGGGGAALSAVVDAVKDGNISPTGLGAAAISAAVAGAIGYRSKPPADKEE